MSNRPHSIQTAQAVPDDDVIDIVGQLQGVKVKTDKTGKTFYSIRLSEGGESIPGSVWTKNTPEPLIGQTVIVRQAKMGSWNGKRNFSAMRGAIVEEFSEDMDAPPQQAPMDGLVPKAPTSHAPAQQMPVKATGSARLNEYAALYAACIGAARATSAATSFDGSPESIRNIASCFFIQAIKDGVKLEGAEPDEKVPF